MFGFICLDVVLSDNVCRVFVSDTVPRQECVLECLECAAQTALSGNLSIGHAHPDKHVWNVVVLRIRIEY